MNSSSHVRNLAQRWLAVTCLLAASFTALAQPAKTLRFVPQADLKVLDPIFTTNYVTRNFGYLVYDTLFGLDSQGVPRPQMVEKYISSKDGRQWRFMLRAGLKFHDGQPVTAADCVASLQRWSEKDSYGRAMVAAGAKWSTEDPRTFTLTLQEQFGLVLEALSKVSSHAPFIMPERSIKAAGAGQVMDGIGSGPYRFKRDEWSPGNKAVFVRNADYAGRSEPSSFLAGNKRGIVDRIEWVVLPDANSATAALKNGEVDLLELVPPDNLVTLRTDANVRIGTAGAYQGDLILNHLHPPFNHPKARQAVLAAVNQERFIAAMGYPLDMRMKHCASFFICGNANETAAGGDPFRTPDLARARQLIAESGYKGEKVVVLVPTDYANLNGAALTTVQLFKDLGLNVEAQTMDWASIVSRRVKKDAPDKGGWNAYATFAVESSIDSPLMNFMLGAACGNSMPGWPCDKPLDELRTEWTRESLPARRRALLDKFQLRTFEAVPMVPLGQYTAAFGVRKSVKNQDKLGGDVPLLWLLDK